MANAAALKFCLRLVTMKFVDDDDDECYILGYVNCHIVKPFCNSLTSDDNRGSRR